MYTTNCLNHRIKQKGICGFVRPGTQWLTSPSAVVQALELQLPKKTWGFLSWLINCPHTSTHHTHTRSNHIFQPLPLWHIYVPSEVALSLGKVRTKWSHLRTEMYGADETLSLCVHEVGEMSPSGWWKTTLWHYKTWASEVELMCSLSLTLSPPPFLSLSLSVCYHSL